VVILIPDPAMLAEPYYLSPLATNEFLNMLPNKKTFMKQEELKIAISKLEADHEAGELMMMQTVNRLYDLERDYHLAPEAIAAHVTDEDIKDNYLAIPRK
jgi:hypothetical protein